MFFFFPSDISGEGMIILLVIMMLVIIFGVVWILVYGNESKTTKQG